MAKSKFDSGRLAALLIAAAVAVPAAAAAQDCPVAHDKLVNALKASVKSAPANGGFGNNEWAAVVDRAGRVCAVAFSGSKPDDQWPGSRAIAIEKAGTANAFSLDSFAISTANLYAGAQPGGYLFGLVTTNPPDPAAHEGDAKTFGSDKDPALGKRMGGIVVFGGGLALYDGKSVLGGLGVSGDTSCADHNVAWRLRHELGLDKVPNGVTPDKNDGIIYDIGKDGKSASGFGHPLCHRKEAEIAESIGSGVNATPK